MTILTIALLAVLILRRTKLTVLVASAALTGELIVSSWSPIASLELSQASQGLWMTGINVLLAFLCALHWRSNNNEVSKYITWLAFAAACFSFTRLIVFSSITDVALHSSVQGSLASCVDWITMAAIACLLFLPDKSVTIYDLVRNIVSGFIWIRDGVYLLSDRVGR